MNFSVFALTTHSPSYAQAARSRLQELGYSPEIVGTEEWLRVKVGEETDDPVEADSAVVNLKAAGFRSAFALAESSEPR